MDKIEYGYCHCGCGQKTNLVKDARDGYQKDEPYLFRRAHNFRRNTLERFWEKVDKRGPDDCWMWLASTSHGYGQFNDTVNDKKHDIQAHRYSYQIAHNVTLTHDEFVCHSCDTPGCVNPAHLFLGTSKDNTQDMVNKGRARGGIMIGSENRNTSLTESDIITIREQAAYTSFRKLGKIFNLSKTAIARIVHKKTWTHVP